MVIANPCVSTTLIQTEDLAALCDEVDEVERLRLALADMTAARDAADDAMLYERW